MSHTFMFVSRHENNLFQVQLCNPMHPHLDIRCFNGQNPKRSGGRFHFGASNTPRAQVITHEIFLIAYNTFMSHTLHVRFASRKTCSLPGTQNSATHATPTHNIFLFAFVVIDQTPKCVGTLLAEIPFAASVESATREPLIEAIPCCVDRSRNSVQRCRPHVRAVDAPSAVPPTPTSISFLFPARTYCLRSLSLRRFDGDAGRPRLVPPGVRVRAGVVRERPRLPSPPASRAPLAAILPPTPPPPLPPNKRSCNTRHELGRSALCCRIRGGVVVSTPARQSRRCPRCCRRSSQVAQHEADAAKTAAAAKEAIARTTAIAEDTAVPSRAHSAAQAMEMQT